MTLTDFDPDEFYRTTDMGLASYLKLESFTPQAVVWSDESCYWIFRMNEAIDKAADVYLGGHALVEPRRYNAMYGNTKKEFHRAMDSHGRIPA